MWDTYHIKDEQWTCLTPHLLLQLCVAGSHGEKHHFGIAIRTQEQHTLLSLSATQERFTCCNVFKLLHSTSVKIPSETGKRVRCDQGYTVTHVKSTLTVTRFDSDHNQGWAYISKDHTAQQRVKLKRQKQKNMERYTYPALLLVERVEGFTKPVTSHCTEYCLPLLQTKPWNARLVFWQTSLWVVYNTHIHHSHSRRQQSPTTWQSICIVAEEDTHHTVHTKETEYIRTWGTSIWMSEWRLSVHSA